MLQGERQECGGKPVHQDGGIPHHRSWAQPQVYHLQGTLGFCDLRACGDRLWPSCCEWLAWPCHSILHSCSLESHPHSFSLYTFPNHSRALWFHHSVIPQSTPYIVIPILNLLLLKSILTHNMYIPIIKLIISICVKPSVNSLNWQLTHFHNPLSSLKYVEHLEQQTLCCSLSYTYPIQGQVFTYLFWVWLAMLMMSKWHDKTVACLVGRR